MKVTRKDIGKQVMMMKCSPTVSTKKWDHGGGRGCSVPNGTIGKILEVDPNSFLVRWKGKSPCYVMPNDEWVFYGGTKTMPKKRVKKKTKLTFVGIACKKCGIKPLTNPESIKAKMCQKCTDEVEDDLGL